MFNFILQSADFFTTVNNVMDFDEEDESKPVDKEIRFGSWGQAWTYLLETPLFIMVPLEVHPDYLSQFVDYIAKNEDQFKQEMDLQSDYVFCVVDDEKEKPSEKNNSIKEYRLQASLVKKAKANKWLLPFEGEKWTLLDAERNFAGEDLSIKKKGKRLDLLAYEAETKTYIVLELKVTRAFEKAKQELLSYTSAISDNLEMANRCYSVVANNVKGYIVWNALSWPPRKTIQTKDNPWGLIEYDEAFLANDKIESINFKLVNEPD